MTDQLEPRIRDVLLWGPDAPSEGGRFLCSSRLIKEQALKEIADAYFLGSLRTVREVMDDLETLWPTASVPDEDDDPLHGKDPVQ